MFRPSTFRLAYLAALTCAASTAFGQTTGSSTGSTSSSSGGGLGSTSGIGSSGKTGGTGTGTNSSPFGGSVAAGFGNQALGGTTSTVTGTTSVNAVPSASNPFKTTYINPYAVGLVPSTGATGKTTSNKVFGQPVYSTTTTISNLSSLANSNNSGFGFTTVNQPKGPHYTTSLADDIPLITRSAEVQQKELIDLLARSSRIKSKDRMRIDIQGAVVVLSGEAANEHDRRLAESLLRLTPGVVAVDNRLKLPGQP